MAKFKIINVIIARFDERQRNVENQKPESSSSGAGKE
jgi:hypothetical protein